MSFSGCNEPGLQRKFGFSMITKCNLTKDYHICNSISNCVIHYPFHKIHPHCFFFYSYNPLFFSFSFFFFRKENENLDSFVIPLFSFSFFLSFLFHSQNPSSHTKLNSFNYRHLNCTYALLLLAYYKVGQYMYIRS